MLRLLIGTQMENLADTVVVVPLLEKFLLVRDGVTLDEVLQLWEVGGEEDATAHGGESGIAERKTENKFGAKLRAKLANNLENAL